jgi:hypothetical protein
MDASATCCEWHAQSKRLRDHRPSPRQYRPVLLRKRGLRLPTTRPPSREEHASYGHQQRHTSPHVQQLHHHHLRNRRLQDTDHTGQRRRLQPDNSTRAILDTGHRRSQYWNVHVRLSLSSVDERIPNSQLTPDPNPQRPPSSLFSIPPIFDPRLWSEIHRSRHVLDGTGFSCSGSETPIHIVASEALGMSKHAISTASQGRGNR